MKLALWFLFGAVLAVVAFDVWVLVLRGYDATISATLAAVCADYPIVSWAIGLGLGVVSGHILWLNQAAARKFCASRGWTPPVKEIGS